MEFQQFKQEIGKLIDSYRNRINHKRDILNNKNNVLILQELRRINKLLKNESIKLSKEDEDFINTMLTSRPDRKNNDFEVMLSQLPAGFKSWMITTKPGDRTPEQKQEYLAYKKLLTPEEKETYNTIQRMVIYSSNPQYKQILFADNALA